MRQIMIVLTLLFAMAGMATADTLYLRDGRVMQGTIIGYEQGQFRFETSNGEQTIYSVWQVSRLVVDRASASDANRDRRFPGRDRDTMPSSSGNARWESAPAFDVRLQDQWIRSQLQVRRGQRVRVESTGSVTLEGRYSVNPDGQPNSRNASLPMPNQNDGALIAVIGKDENAPPILIGRQREFVADRDGMLYFTVNHWEIRNAGGAFRVTVSVDRGAGRLPGDSDSTIPRREKVITIAGNQAWLDTGIDLDADMTLDIVAEGQIAFRRNQLVGPDGDRNYNARDVIYPMNNSGVGALIAKIRYQTGTDSAPRFIGAHSTQRVGSSEYGRLFLGINDNNVSDNTGSYRVTIRW